MTPLPPSIRITDNEAEDTADTTEIRPPTDDELKNVTDPEVVKRVYPPYPETAVRRALEGNVILSCYVKPDGRVKKAIIVQSDATIFNQPSLRAVMQWQFKAPTEGNRLFSVWVTFPLRFQLGVKR